MKKVAAWIVLFVALFLAPYAKGLITPDFIAPTEVWEFNTHTSKYEVRVCSHTVYLVGRSGWAIEDGTSCGLGWYVDILP